LKTIAAKLIQQEGYGVAFMEAGKYGISAVESITNMLKKQWQQK